MSLTIAIKIPDGIIIITESHEINVSTNEIISNNRTKYFIINNNVICAPLGVKPAIDNSIRLLNANNNRIIDRTSLINEVINAASNGYKSFIETLQNIGEGQNYKLALIVGALLNGEAFIYTIVVGLNISNTTGLIEFFRHPYELKKAFDSVAAGKEQEHVGESMRDYVLSIKDTWRGQDKCKNNFVENIIEKGKELINDVARNNIDVGGEIKYIILRNNFPIEEGIA